ncbi:hypothetical protein BKA93DRAFT_754456 [Sparassis latifolia]
MPGRAKSATLKAHIVNEKLDKLMIYAITAYEAEQAKPPNEARKELEGICKEIAREHLCRVNGVKLKITAGLKNMLIKFAKLGILFARKKLRLTPLIFKDQAFQVKWQQANPLKALYAWISKEGLD